MPADSYRYIDNRIQRQQPVEITEEGIYAFQLWPSSYWSIFVFESFLNFPNKQITIDGYEKVIVTKSIWIEEESIISFILIIAFYG